MTDAKPTMESLSDEKPPIEATTNFSDLYKSHGDRDPKRRQEERRKELLEKQKRNREHSADQLRNIEFRKRKVYKEPESLGKQFKLQLSEWLIEPPEDLSKWYIRPCPKAQRCLVIAANGETIVYARSGRKMKTIRSILPGSCTYKRTPHLTVLDCFFDHIANIFYILDVIAYKSLDLSECEAEFRFYWIENKIVEDNLDVVNDRNPYPFKMIQKVNCADYEAFNRLISEYPIWENDSPKLDGFLFYHMESAYVEGTTPLVGWLHSFMLPELFDVELFNDRLNEGKPSNYTTYMAFIRDFDKHQKSIYKKRFKKIEKMDTNELDDESKTDAVEETCEMDDESKNDVVEESMLLEEESDETKETQE